MKTERRHELQTNVLADKLGHMIVWLKARQTQIVTILGVALVATAIIVIWNKQSGSKSREAWDQYSAATYSKNAAGDISKVADEYASLPAGIWARLLVAKGQYESGTQLLFQNREEGTDELGRARDGFSKVRDDTRDPMLQQFATLCLARVHESLGDGKSAAAEYKKLADNSLYSEAAKRQLERLENKGTQQFLAALAEFRPTPGITMPDFLAPDKTPASSDSKTFGSLIDELDKIKLPNEGSSKTGADVKTEPESSPVKTEPTKTPGS